MNTAGKILYKELIQIIKKSKNNSEKWANITNGRGMSVYDNKH